MTARQSPPRHTPAPDGESSALIAAPGWAELAKNARQVEADGSQRATRTDPRLEMEPNTGPTRESTFDIFLHGSHRNKRSPRRRRHGSTVFLDRVFT